MCVLCVEYAYYIKIFQIIVFVLNTMYSLLHNGTITIIFFDMTRFREITTYLSTFLLVRSYLAPTRENIFWPQKNKWNNLECRAVVTAAVFPNESRFE